ncbi:helix-turn-helix domain-containing protein [Promicromonospora sp. AC04]|uniref:helix-turn-helix domain-containing protein n=1 Tax=Promicromonospora sp. AC04 TaxID=2135723 RepID=UPI0021007E46|nr:helix-turn-helix domain-containing protein [Promicromonospora sp. AC04]
MFVVPRPTVRAALARPVTGRLLVTDAGLFPHAAHHGRLRHGGASQHILMVCTSGTGWCRTPDGRFAVQRGDAVLLPANVAHEYAASDDDPWTLWWLHFVGLDSAELVRSAHHAAGGPLSHLRDPAPVASLVSQVIDALDSGTAGGLVRASGAAWNALAQLIATGRRTPGPALSPVEQAVEHLRATTPQRTSVDALAAMVGLSPSQLNTVFRQQVGVPPLRYQSDLRMARARELLDSTELAVAAIAHSCGYDDPLYFSRQFTRTHGLAPTAYRARVK